MKNKLLILSLFLLTGCNLNISSYNSLTQSSEINSSSSIIESSTSSVISSSSSTYIYEPIQYIKVDANSIDIDPYVGLSHNEFY